MNPISGPEGFGLASGLLSDAEQAKADKPTLADLTRLLAAYRAGGDKTELLHRLRYIPYGFFERFNANCRIAAEDVLGALYFEFAECIRRLRTGKKGRCVPAEEVEGYICGYLCHVAKHYAAQISPHIRAERSTNHARKQRGEERYADLNRVPDAAQPPHLENDEDGDDSYVDSRLDAAIDAYDDHYDDETWELLSDLDAVVEDEIEKQIIWYLEERKSRAEIADLLGMTAYRVRQIIARIKTRLRRS